MKTNDEFVSALTTSNDYVWAAAKWLSGCGYQVLTNPLLIRPEYKDRSRYTDNGDLGVLLRVEVKHRPGMEFRSLDDFPYQDVIVDEVHKWERTRPKPYVYLILNADATCAIVVLGATQKRWSKMQRYDRKNRNKCEFYTCPLADCTFWNLSEQPELFNHG